MKMERWLNLDLAELESVVGGWVNLGTIPAPPVVDSSFDDPVVPESSGPNCLTF